MLMRVSALTNYLICKHPVLTLPGWIWQGYSQQDAVGGWHRPQHRGSSAGKAHVQTWQGMHVYVIELVALCMYAAVTVNFLA